MTALGNGPRRFVAFTEAEVTHVLTDDDSVTDERRHNAAYLLDLLRRLYLNIPIRNGIDQALCDEVESVIGAEARR